MDTLTRIQQPIVEELARYNQLFDEAMQHENPLLRMALEHLAKRRGKQMRPVLVLLAAKLYGKVNNAVLQAALAVELLHTASLVHDDVVDESDRRRGQASINALFDNRAAVLVGDYLISKALQASAMTGSVEFVNHCALLGQALADGELQQINNTQLESFEEASYYEVISKKTASLFATCAQTGAMLGGGTASDAECMRQFGKLLGMCFQLRDDIFDFTRVDVGKPVGQDMHEGKLTLPVLYALRKVERTDSNEQLDEVIPSDESQRMRELGIAVRQGEASDEDIATLVNYTLKQGGIEYANWAMDEFRMMAIGLINEERNPEVAQAMRDYVNFVVERQV